MLLLVPFGDVLFPHSPQLMFGADRPLESTARYAGPRFRQTCLMMKKTPSFFSAIIGVVQVVVVVIVEMAVSTNDAVAAQVIVVVAIIVFLANQRL